MRPSATIAAIAFCVVALLVLVGCSTALEWDPQAGTVTSAQLDQQLKSAATDDLKAVSVAQARERRDRALAGLREENGGSEVADVLTKAFARGNAGVPVYIGRGTFSGKQAIIVIEAYGAPGGKLEHKRLWVLSEDGTPLYSSTAP